jgi:hypothetical protein
MKRVYVVVNNGYGAAFMFGDQTLSDKRDDLKSADFYDNIADAEFNFPSRDYLKYEVECFIDMKHDKEAAKSMIEKYCDFQEIEADAMLKNLEETGLIEESALNYTNF